MTSPADSQSVLAWLPGEVQCGGLPVVATPMRRPLTSLMWGGAPATVPVRYLFSIDETGRTFRIRRTGTDFVPYGDDIAPSLAATRFAADAPRQDCVVTYLPRRTALADTPVDDLISYTMTPGTGVLPREGWKRIERAGTCLDQPRPQPLLQGFPDFATVTATPGVRDWTMLDFDTDARGRPIGVRVATGTRNPALDAAAVTALAASRYTGAARTGCRYPYWRAAGRVAPPPVPEEASFRPANSTCPAGRDWATPPVLRFPENYRRRAIEGWAVVTYDVAPWGEIGNLQVAAAQPSEDFGREAMSVMRSARLPAGTPGAVGCVDRVIFKMGTEAGAAYPPETPPF